MMSKKFLIHGFLISLCLSLITTANVNAAADPTCDSLMHPDDTRSWLITILEEEISKEDEGNGKDVFIINCLRITTLEPTGDGDKKQAKTSYADVAAGSCPENALSCQRIQVFFTKSGISLLYSYIGLIYRWGAGTIGIVCVFYLIYGVAQIATAGDNAGRLDEAKTKIGQSIAGLVLLFLSGIILYTINPNFFVL